MFIHGFNRVCYGIMWMIIALYTVKIAQEGVISYHWHDVSAYMMLIAMILTLYWTMRGLWVGSGRAFTWSTWHKLVEEFYPVLVVVLLFRTCCFDMYRIPSGSMKPTLWEGDFVVVNKYRYGITLPITLHRLTTGVSPQRGDIVVFYLPSERDKQFIKRVVGLPGDTIRYYQKTLFINGQAQSLQLKGYHSDRLGVYTYRVKEGVENLEGIPHSIWIQTQREEPEYTWQLKENEYFLMGDNRDNSKDSRYWGALSGHYIVGRAMYISLSWDSEHHDLRWHRMGSALNP